MKYYKPQLAKEIKEMYFKHFQYLNINDKILTKTFRYQMLFMVKDLDDNYFKFKKLVDDYFMMDKNDYTLQSELMINYKNLIVTSSEIVSLNLDIEKEHDKILNEVIQILSSSNSYLVGGSIRDMMNGTDVHDFDFATDIPYDILQDMFEKNSFKVVQAGKDFLVLHISKDDKTFEVANFRKDGVYLNGRKPETVEIGTIEDDAQRRDFTCNSLYFNLKTQQIVDPNGSIKDLFDKKLRFIGDTDARLKEDLLRVFRGYRFISKGYVADSKTLRSLRSHFEEATVKVSFERIRSEIEKIVGIK